MSQKEMFRAVVDSPDTYLTTAINSMDTTIFVEDVSVLSDAPGIATLHDDLYTETIKYTVKDVVNNKLAGITRGFDGTARDWAQGKAIARLITAYDINTIKDNIEDLNTNKLGISGGTLTGIVTAQSNTSYTVKQVRNMILSTADADTNLMSDGDVWIKYV